jgi:hypothetical protein
MGFFGSGLVVRPPASAGALAQAAPAPGAPAAGNGEINLSNILKLIPADIVAVYLAGNAVSPETVFWGKHWPFWFCWLCVLACIIVRYAATKSAPSGVNWLLILVSTVAFFIWAHAVSEQHGPVIDIFHGAIAGVVAMLFGIVAPAIVPAQP